MAGWILAGVLALALVRACYRIGRHVEHAEKTRRLLETVQARAVGVGGAWVRVRTRALDELDEHTRRRP